MSVSHLALEQLAAVLAKLRFDMTTNGSAALAQFLRTRRVRIFSGACIEGRIQ
jgi:hypothetical protein